ncbi:uncharacterized protein LOC141909305 [Tubulanus polymorphus]|uniref:uncharacterized protein LOC141909305 n=1 Tax=Tubulanus polymorphus TaxID=672921 RepID=UPI003DA45B34
MKNLKKHLIRHAEDANTGQILGHIVIPTPPEFQKKTRKIAPKILPDPLPQSSASAQDVEEDSEPEIIDTDTDKYINKDYTSTQSSSLKSNACENDEIEESPLLDMAFEQCPGDIVEPFFSEMPGIPSSDDEVLNVSGENQFLVSKGFGLQDSERVPMSNTSLIDQAWDSSLNLGDITDSMIENNNSEMRELLNTINILPPGTTSEKIQNSLSSVATQSPQPVVASALSPTYQNVLAHPVMTTAFRSPHVPVTMTPNHFVIGPAINNGTIHEIAKLQAKSVANESRQVCCESDKKKSSIEIISENGEMCLRRCTVPSTELPKHDQMKGMKSMNERSKKVIVKRLVIKKADMVPSEITDGTKPEMMSRALQTSSTTDASKTDEMTVPQNDVGELNSKYIVDSQNMMENLTEIVINNDHGKNKSELQELNLNDNLINIDSVQGGSKEHVSDSIRKWHETQENQQSHEGNSKESQSFCGGCADHVEPTKVTAVNEKTTSGEENEVVMVRNTIHSPSALVSSSVKHKEVMSLIDDRNNGNDDEVVDANSSDILSSSDPMVENEMVEADGYHDMKPISGNNDNSENFDKPKPYICDICHKSFQLLTNLHLHQRSHNGERPYVCHVCEKSFTHKSNLNRHLRIHSGSKPYVCGYCGKAFVQSSGCKEHVKIHLRESGSLPPLCTSNELANKPYQCSQCLKRFPIQKRLVKHVSCVHSGKMHVCNVCDKSFVRIEHFRRHYKTHTGEKNFKCKHCDAKFAENYDLKVHMRRHQNVKPFECQHCQMRFCRTADLRKHESRHERAQSGGLPFHPRISTRKRLQNSNDKELTDSTEIAGEIVLTMHSKINPELPEMQKRDVNNATRGSSFLPNHETNVIHAETIVKPNEEDIGVSNSVEYVILDDHDIGHDNNNVLFVVEPDENNVVIQAQ